MDETKWGEYFRKNQIINIFFFFLYIYLNLINILAYLFEFKSNLNSKEEQSGSDEMGRALRKNQIINMFSFSYIFI